MSRLRGRVDATQREIASALRQVGASVAITSNVGDGFPDLVVGAVGTPEAPNGRIWLLECKDGAKPPSKRKLTPAQVQFRAEWRGPAPVTVTSVDEALELLRRDV